MTVTREGRRPRPPQKAHAPLTRTGRTGAVTSFLSVGDKWPVVLPREEREGGRGAQSRKSPGVRAGGHMEPRRTLGPLGTATSAGFSSTRDAGGGAGSFRGAAAGTAAAHRTSTPPDRDTPTPAPQDLEAGGAASRKQGAGARPLRAGSSGRRSPADRCRGPARGPESAGRRFPSAARAFVAVTRWARAASARSGRARS